MSDNNLSLKNIIVAVNPAQKEHYALERALMMNRILEGGVNIHLFISMDMEDLRKDQDTFEYSCEGGWHDELVKPMVDAGIDYTSEILWTDEWHRSITQMTKKRSADLVIMSDYATEKGQTELSSSKWALLRVSKCPVMIVHPSSKMERQTILAAVNMQTDNPRYAELNEKILSYSNLLAIKYGAEKHVVNGYEDGMEYPDRARLLRETDTKQENLHLKQGGPKSIISEVATEINADVVVIGTLARSGVMAAVKGNKSESIIRDLTSDVMVLN